MEMLTPEAVRQVLLLVSQASFLAVTLLGLFRLRDRIGITPLYLAVGSLQYLQVVLALSIYVEIVPGINVSPGSAVLFPATLFTVLLVYIRLGVAKARLLIFGLVVANVVSVVLSKLVGAHLDSTLARNLYELPRELFFHDLRLMLVGSASLALDAVLLVVVYEAFAKLLRRTFFLRTALALALVLTVDSVLFVVGAFWGREELSDMLLSSLAGKLPMALLYAAFLTAYFLVLRRGALGRELSRADRHEVLEVLTYRERYEQLRQQLHRDPLTGLYDRGFFDDFLVLALARSARSGNPGTLALLDLDHFKSINDSFGHLVGDRVLKAVAEELIGASRESDAACRIGGEEFALVLPSADRAAARECVERVRSKIAARMQEDPALRDLPPVTFTAGVAEFPGEAEDAERIFELADQRLYAGKRAGRDRVISE